MGKLARLVSYGCGNISANTFLYQHEVLSEKKGGFVHCITEKNALLYLTNEESVGIQYGMQTTIGRFNTIHVMTIQGSHPRDLCTSHEYTRAQKASRRHARGAAMSNFHADHATCVKESNFPKGSHQDGSRLENEASRDDFTAPSTSLRLCSAQHSVDHPGMCHSLLFGVNPRTHHLSISPSHEREGSTYQSWVVGAGGGHSSLCVTNCSTEKRTLV